MEYLKYPSFEETKSNYMHQRSPKPSLLGGRTVLVVEDETIISLEIEQMLRDLDSGTVWHAANVSQALAILAENRPGLAILDVTLGSEKAFPIADVLIDKQIAFIFSTGYGRESLPLEWSGWPVIQKPYLTSELASALQSLLGR